MALHEDIGRGVHFDLHLDHLIGDQRLRHIVNGIAEPSPQDTLADIECPAVRVNVHQFGDEIGVPSR